MINNTVALELEPDGEDVEPAPLISEGQSWEEYAARALAWGQRGWNLAEQRGQAIDAAIEQSRNIKD